MKIYILKLDGMAGYILPNLEAARACVGEEMDTLEEGFELQITVGEMSQEEYDKLPEFQGW